MASVLEKIQTVTLKISVGLALLLCAGGCGKSATEAEGAPPRNPSEAASQIEKAFVQSAPEIKQNAGVASDAMQKGDYEKAVASLHVLQQQKGITLEQGLAIHHSMVALEGQLISAMESGDQNAKRAYQLLKELKRN
jgi:hypothetical protein